MIFKKSRLLLINLLSVQCLEASMLHVHEIVATLVIASERWFGQILRHHGGPNLDVKLLDNGSLGSKIETSHHQTAHSHVTRPLPKDKTRGCDVMKIMINGSTRFGEWLFCHQIALGTVIGLCHTIV